eukprot:gnl/TRDRNA2_/TRDRNA2_158248_c0_seq1.p1 gnl/TRDRNA2_/TRDRNA2_158248_c0~~gnl/TRDRNA2_/TRDRNA2_158248_c0_seq1.p1  ORF type:complete len:404 (+),score=55.08 gnl/TRDRNA2_/TRDRNA2_158248_c0_seq1:191-1402(+)
MRSIVMILLLAGAEEEPTTHRRRSMGSSTAQTMVKERDNPIDEVTRSMAQGSAYEELVEEITRAMGQATPEEQENRLDELAKSMTRASLDEEGSVDHIVVPMAKAVLNYPRDLVDSPDDTDETPQEILQAIDLLLAEVLQVQHSAKEQLKQLWLFWEKCDDQCDNLRDWIRNSNEKPPEFRYLGEGSLANYAEERVGVLLNHLGDLDLTLVEEDEARLRLERELADLKIELAAVGDEGAGEELLERIEDLRLDVLTRARSVSQMFIEMSKYQESAEQVWKITPKPGYSSGAERVAAATAANRLATEALAEALTNKTESDSEDSRGPKGSEDSSEEMVYWRGRALPKPQGLRDSAPEIEPPDLLVACVQFSHCPAAALVGVLMGSGLIARACVMPSVSEPILEA